MALETTRSLGQLKQECNMLGLEVKVSQPREKKEDYIKALRQHHIGILYPNGLPKSLEMMISLDCPMLCRRYQELKPQEQENLWTSPLYYAERKIDGARMVIFNVDNGPLNFFSRNLSVKDYLPSSYQDKILTEGVDFSKLKHQFIVDAEVVCKNPNVSTILEKKGVVTETGLQATTAILALNPEQSHELQRTEAPLTFMVFDCLFYDGKWLLDLPLKERRKYLKLAFAELKEAGLSVEAPEASYKNRKAFYNYIVKSGGEGVVFKNLMGKYNPTTSRPRDGWIKLKRSTSEALGDTIDGFITGFVKADPDKGWADVIGGIEVSVILKSESGEEKEHMIARVSNIPMEDKKKMTELGPDGTPQLKKEYYGKVVEVDGQCITARVRRLKHAVLVRWRPDRSASTCIMDESFLESMIL